MTARLRHLRQPRSFRPGLEALETRELLSSTAGFPDFSDLRNDLAQLRNDLVSTVQPSSTNTPTLTSLESQWSKTWSVLAADWSKTYQAFVQVEYAALGALQQEFNTLLHDLGFQLPGQSSLTSPPAATNSVPPGQIHSTPSPSSAPLVQTNATTGVPHEKWTRG